MKEILLDTSGYSAFLRGHAGVGDAVRHADLIAVNPIVLGELWAGFRRGNRLEKNRAELKTFLASPRVDVIDLDAETSIRYAAIVETLAKAGTPIPTNDLWIAASAMQYGLSVVTTDDHFRRVPQVLVDYFAP
ncbi:MAG TPA: type II toxin-antitoxin system VapC family toxin [Planctomycetota bacterium]